MALELGSQSWPPELLFLRDRFPREGWPGNPALGELAQFWLHKHASLSRLGAGLVRAGVAVREGHLEPRRFQAGFPPALGQFLAALESHHHVEDHHYFPAFRAAEERLARGFETLESDHGLLSTQIATVVDLNRNLARQTGPDRDALMRSLERCIDEVSVLEAALGRHLADEEDLVIPLLARERGRF